MNWTDERVELLKKLWSEGLSASQIAAQLGGVSRNAVIGKAHRLKLSGRGKTAKPQPRQRKAPTAPVAAAPRPRPVAETISAAETPPPVRENRTQNVDGAAFGTSAFKVEAVVDAIVEPQMTKKDNVIPMARHLTLLQLTENTCKWPMGDPLTDDFHFCGADSGEGNPYCAYHSKIAFQPVSERRRIKV